jgi:hypothetical protein
MNYIIDDIRPRQARAQPPPIEKVIQAEVPQMAKPQRVIRARPTPPPERRRGLPEWIQLPLIIFGAILAGMFAQSAIFGQLAVVAYGIVAVVMRIPSRTTFILASLSMIATTLLLVLKGDVAFSQNFATYTFLLLVVGVITLNRELKKEGGRIYSIRKNIQQ